MKTWKIILILFILLIIGVFSYFLFFGEGDDKIYDTQKELGNFECSVGNPIALRIPRGEEIGGGDIFGVESHDLVVGGNKNFCCAIITSSNDNEYKYCYIKDGNILTNEIWFEDKQGDYKKIEESAPWNGYNCKYSFSEDGTWSRSCL